MKKIWILGLLFGVFGCKSYNTPNMEKSSSTTSAESTGPVAAEDLVGKTTRADLEKAPFNSWFASGVSNYSPDAAIISELAPQLSGVDITLFMGTWCGDSKDQVPRFYKVLDAAKFNPRKLTLIAVDRGKTTPDKLEQGLNISNVPTFIFYRAGKEIGRIVESPVETLEKDMLKIVSGKAYQHTYER